MNGLDNIIEKIKSDAEVVADKVLEEAKGEAAQITAEHDALAEQESTSVAQAGAEQAKELEQRAVSIAQLEVRKNTLAKKQEMIALAFEGAKQRILDMDEATYADLLCKLAVNNSVSGSEEIVLNQRDNERLGAKLVETVNQQLQAADRPHALTLSEETREIEGGLFLKDGSVETNCRISAIVSIMKEELTGEVASILFS